LEKNKLELIVRGNQLQEEGYGEVHDGKVATIFAASKYCGQCSNKGAVMTVNSKMERKYFVYEVSKTE
jgi:hypothetical protein